jgi:hypothetical protein
MLSGLTVDPASGAVMEIKATFRPDSSKPLDNKFVNETPVTGHCELQPVFCKERGLFSLLTPIGFQSVAAIEARHTDKRRGAMFRVPGEWQKLRVTHVESTEEEVEVRIVSIGGRYILPDTAENLVGEGEPTTVQGWHTRLWGDWTWAPPSPCQPTGGMYTGPSARTFFWMTPNASECAATANYRIANLSYDRVEIGYELRTPHPLTMSAGLYTGIWTYSIGPGMDFDMGDIMHPDDSMLTLSFTLDVQHTLKVDIPPGGNKVQLVPVGGWQSWLQAGRRPVRLFRDQTFTISASSKFKMQLECEISAPSYECMIMDPVTHRAVELRISTSLPNGLTDLAGQPVKHLRLRTGAANAPQFQPGFYVDRAPGVLHFEVPADQMGFMLSPGQPGHYSGKVTVIWDSEV